MQQQRILSVTQARSLYIRRMAESKNTSSSKEQDVANQQLKQATRALQQAQMTERLRSARGATITRPGDWNVETW